MASRQADSTGAGFPDPDGATMALVVDGRSVPLASDDECLALLAKAVEDHDPESLDTVARLIGRLAVPIE
jgi:hypothetical protein